MAKKDNDNNSSGVVVQTTGDNYHSLYGSDYQDKAAEALGHSTDFQLSRDREDWLNVASYYQHLADRDFNKSQADLEYERSKAENQVQLLMAAGMTRQAALAVLSGGSQQSASASPDAPQFSNDSPNEMTELLDAAQKMQTVVKNGFAGVQQVFDLQAAMDQLPLTLEQMRNLNTISQYQGDMAANAYNAMRQENAYWSAFDHATQSGNNFKSPLDAVKYFGEHASDDPSFANFANLTKGGFVGEAWRNIMKGNQETHDSIWAADVMAARAMLETLQPEKLLEEIEVMKAEIQNLISGARVNHAHANVIEETGVEEVRSRIGLNNAQKEQALSEAYYKGELGYSQSLENKIADYNFEQTKLWTHNQLVFNAQKLAACLEKKTFDHIKSSIQNDAAMVDYVSALQLWSQQATITDYKNNKEFAKWCNFWNSPSIRDGLGLYIQSQKLKMDVDQQYGDPGSLTRFGNDLFGVSPSLPYDIKR